MKLIPLPSKMLISSFFLLHSGYDDRGGYGGGGQGGYGGGGGGYDQRY